MYPHVLADQPPVPVRSCATHAEGVPPAAFVKRARDLDLGRIVLLGGAAEHKPAGHPLHGDDTYKIPVAVRAGPAVTLRLTRAGDRARLDVIPERWRGEHRSVAAGDGERVARFVACDPDTPRFSDDRPLGPWTFYPGGFLVARPGCATLTATSAGARTVRRRIALGVPRSRC